MNLKNLFKRKTSLNKPQDSIKIQPEFSLDKIEDFDNYMVDWNLKFPFDRWWRKKYNVPFLSEQHRNASFFDMMREYREDKMFSEHESSNYEKGDWIKVNIDPDSDRKAFNRLKKKKHE